MRLRALVFASMMAALAVLLQTAPTWAGQPVGFALAVLAFLPFALSAVAEARAAALALAVATLLCAAINPEEAWVLGLTNGPFGIALGLAARDNLPWPRALLLPAGTLLAGVTALTWGVSLAALGPEVLALGFPTALAVYAVFAVVWSALGTWAVRLVDRRTRPILSQWAQSRPPRA